MDQHDKNWVDSMQDKYPGLTYDFFELVIDRIEKQWFKVLKSIPKSEKDDNAYPEEIVCSICDDGEAENCNAIVFCDGCNLAGTNFFKLVHQDCYGVPFIPEGQWLCRKCMLSPEKPVVQYQLIQSCALCPISGGAFKQTNTSQWAHLLCAMWIPECRIANTVFMEPIEGLEAIPKSRWKLLCYICKTRKGAPIQCSSKNCFVPFHASCAQLAKLCMEIKGQGDTATFNAFCDRHSPKEYTKDVDVRFHLKRAQTLFRSDPAVIHPRPRHLTQKRTSRPSKAKTARSRLSQAAQSSVRKLSVHKKTSQNTPKRTVDRILGSGIKKIINIVKTEDVPISQRIAALGDVVNEKTGTSLKIKSISARGRSLGGTKEKLVRTLKVEDLPISERIKTPPPKPNTPQNAPDKTSPRRIPLNASSIETTRQPSPKRSSPEKANNKSTTIPKPKKMIHRPGPSVINNSSVLQSAPKKIVAIPSTSRKSSSSRRKTVTRSNTSTSKRHIVPIVPLKSNLKSCSIKEPMSQTVSSVSPIIPQVVLDAIMSMCLPRSTVSEKDTLDIVILICKFWALKRQSRSGAALLKRLHLEPWAFVPLNKEGEINKAKTYETLLIVRRDLERARTLTDLVRKRERDSLRLLKVRWQITEPIISPLTDIFRYALSKCIE